MNNISFYNPQIFFALLFIGIVILIHFIGVSRVLKVSFSTLRFFNQKAELARKTRTLRKLLQLFVRCSIIVVIILLFARPTNKSDPLSKLHNPQSPVYIWIDHSISMDYNDAQISLGQFSTNVLGNLKKELHTTSKIYYYDNDKEKFVLNGESEKFYSLHKPSDLNKAFDQIRNLKFKDGAVIILFSDFQLSVTNILEKNLPGIPKKITVICVPVTPVNPWNYSLKDVKNNNESISALLKIQGKSLCNSEIVAESKNMRIGRLAINISGNKDSAVSIHCNNKMDGTEGKITLNAQDPLSFDNSAYFLSESFISKRVVIVGDSMECVPIALALKISSKQMWNPVIIREATEVTFDELDLASLIIVNKINGSSNVLTAFLNDYSQINKPVIFCYGAEDEVNEWSDAILSKMLPSFEHDSFKQLSIPISPVLSDTVSELWQDFKKSISNDILIYKMCSGIDGEVLLKLTDGSALLVKSKDNKGRKWLILATPLGITNANNLSETGFYVPFVDRVCRYITSSDIPVNNIWTAGRAYKNPFFRSGQNFTIIDTESKIVKTVRKDQPYYSLDKPGIYKMISQNTHSKFLVVQPDAEESDLKYSIPECDSNVVIVNSEKLLSSVKENGNNSFISYLWFMLALLLVIEVLLWEHVNSVKKKQL